MIHKFIKLGILIATALGNAVAQTPTADEAFQGIKWGGSISDIKQRFPASSIKQAPADCENDSFLKAKGISCTRMVLPDYSIAGLAFTVSFYLSSSDKTLREVGLYAESPVDGKPAEAQARSAAAPRCKELQQLISTKYGYSADSVADDPSRSMYVAFANWFDGSPSTYVKLTCSSGTYLTQFTISYSPKKHPDSQKL